MLFCSIRHAIPMIAMCVAVLAALKPPVAEAANRRLELAVLHSDEYAESVLTIQPAYPLAFGTQEHAKISSILDTAREMLETAYSLVRDKRTMREGRKMMEEADAMFKEVKDHIRQRLPQQGNSHLEDRETTRELLRAKYSNHDLQQATEDEARGADVSRRIYETVNSCRMTLPKWLHNVCLISFLNFSSLFQGDHIPRMPRTAL